MCLFCRYNKMHFLYHQLMSKLLLIWNVTFIGVFKMAYCCELLILVVLLLLYLLNHSQAIVVHTTVGVTVY